MLRLADGIFTEPGSCESILGESIGSRSISLWVAGETGAVAAALVRAVSTVHDLSSRETHAARPTAVWVADRTYPDGEAATAWVRGAIQAGRRRLILVSSAEVFTPSHRHLGMVDENRDPERGPIQERAVRWQRLEKGVREAAEAAPETTELVILRPTAMAVPGGKDLWSRLLRGPVAFVAAGFDPSVQWIEVEDTARIVRSLAALPTDRLFGSDGTRCRVFHVTPTGTEPLRRSLRRRGVRPLAIPSPLLRLLRRLQGREPSEVDALCHPFTVDGRRLRRLLESTGAESSPAPVDRPMGSRRGHGSRRDHGSDDPFGLDKPYVDRLGKTLFRFLHDVYWRIEWRGLEHVPPQGKGVLVGVHRGHQPWDGVMVLHRLARSLRRYPRFLVHPTLLKHPFSAPYMIKCGGLHACRENGDYVLDQDELLAIFPEGIRGAFTHYRDAYRLQGFGRYDFVKFALRHRAPIVPFVVVGSAEIFPILGKIKWPWWQCFSEWPCLPITPTLSLLPLPSKWHVLFLDPVPVHRCYGPEAADDPAVVRRIGREVKESMQRALTELRGRRKNVFYGSIFDRSDPETGLIPTSPRPPVAPEVFP